MWLPLPDDVIFSSTGAIYVSFVALYVAAIPMFPNASVSIIDIVKVPSERFDTSIPVMLMFPEMSTVEFPVMLFEVLSKIR